MKGAMVYHQIQSMKEEHTVRDCARKLGVSVNTVRKYAKMDLQEAASYMDKVKRGSQYDVAREFIEQYLSVFPQITATKLLRKVKARYPEISGKVRGFRKYLLPLRQEVKEGEFRHYAPVLDMQPGVQVQVDIGEEDICRNAGGEGFKSYFVSFVFSYSRKGFVSFRGHCYDTDSFIEAHEQAFEYFGGIAEEYVYDQSRLVVIEERYREVFFNERFQHFALKHGFRIRICEGYDPQSKGKVERFIGYVKSDFLYGDYFADVAALNERGREWLEGVANVRLHSVTGRRPSEMFEEERALLRAFISRKRQRRYADKTGLISYQGNKYSVPYPYQRCELEVEESEGYLKLFDPHQDAEIARHRLSAQRGKIIKNNNHYRDYRKSIEDIRSYRFKGETGI
jgi:transposase